MDGSSARGGVVFAGRDAGTRTALRRDRLGASASPEGCALGSAEVADAEGLSPMARCWPGGYLADGTRDAAWRAVTTAATWRSPETLWSSGLRLREGGTLLSMSFPSVRSRHGTPNQRQLKTDQLSASEN